MPLYSWGPVLPNNQNTSMNPAPGIFLFIYLLLRQMAARHIQTVIYTLHSYTKIMNHCSENLYSTFGGIAHNTLEQNHTKEKKKNVN